MKALVKNQCGFVMPAVMFVMALLTVVGIATLATASDEFKSSNALRRSVEAFYAAEAGAKQVVGNWDATYDTLSSGNTLDLGWQPLPSGSEYRAQISRLDNGGQTVIGIEVIGRPFDAAAGERSLSFLLSAGPGGPLSLGACCNAALTVRGGVELEDDAFIDGTDTPPAIWDADGLCTGPMEDKPGVIAQDANVIELADDSWIGTGIVEDTTINDDTFDNYGDASWQDVKDLATSAIGAFGQETEIHWGGDPASDDNRFGPRYKLVGGEWVCDTDHPLNFGSPNPTSPCYDYFPVVLVQGEVPLIGSGGYAQGVFLLDVQGAAGGELELENGVQFNGLIIGKGCVEVQDDAEFHGAIFVDGEYYNNDLCAPDEPMQMHAGVPRVFYSSCVIQRVLDATGLGAAAGSGGGGVSLLDNRSFSELLR